LQASTLCGEQLRPLVLVMEYLYWIDSSTEELVCPLRIRWPPPHSSIEEFDPKLGFTPVTPGEAHAIRQMESKIRGLRVPDEPRQFLITTLYTMRDLNADAIELPEGLSKTTKEPLVVRQLEDLCLKTGLKPLATERHLQPLDLS
jgi:hypothetical protein